MGLKRIEKQKEKKNEIVPIVSSSLSIWSFPVLIPTFFYDDLKFWECPEGGEGNNRTICGKGAITPSGILKGRAQDGVPEGCSATRSDTVRIKILPLKKGGLFI
jgi:hypothetical protein